MKKIVLSAVALLVTLSVCGAEKVSFTVDAPINISKDEMFNVVYEVNAEFDNNSFVPPTFENFAVAAGPSTSTSSFSHTVNGKTTSGKTYAITYTLVPQKEGVCTIGPASIKVDGKRYTTAPMPIGVLGDGYSKSSVGNDDLMLRLDLSKNSVYQGEPIRATLNFYTTRVAAVQAFQSTPVFNGFWSQEEKAEKLAVRRVINGRVYQVSKVTDYILYPQRSGTLTIEPISVSAVARVQVKASYHPFFNTSGFETKLVEQTLKTPAVKVNVKEFPAGAPSSFSGAVGNYTLSHKLSATEVKANSAVTLQLTISGNGNLKFISAPTVSLPGSFELYDVKSEENISGNQGYRRFDYPFIVRAEGEYDIAPIEFSFFDLETQSYKTVATPPMKLVVTPDKGTSSAQQPTLTSGVKREEVKLLGEDIRFIKLGDTKLRSVVAPLVLSSTYWLAMLVMMVVAVLAYLIVRKRIRDNSNEVLVKGRRANRVAVKRFRIAAKYMREQDRRAFYEEMLRGLWGYLSDRFNIPVADLTRDVVRAELQRRGAATEAETIIAVIARCEEAQYSPVATAEMDSIYEEGVEAVSKIEKIAK
ncbi:MAG: protein BatD [Alistipes sp.]|nr:protein BatD [Alistipes sp.]